MRQIKFRGKCIKTGEWLYGDVLRNVEGAVAIVPPFKVNMNNECNVYEVDPETVGQFTGIFINQDEIYEHDLIVSEGVSFEVVYNNQIGAFVLLEVLTQQLGTTPLGEMLETFAFEKIGNIHDNTELVFCVKCGTCPHFENEDAIGNGYCSVNNELKNCTSDACEKWKKNKEGGSK